MRSCSQQHSHAPLRDQAGLDASLDEAHRVSQLRFFVLDLVACMMAGGRLEQLAPAWHAGPLLHAGCHSL